MKNIVKSIIFLFIFIIIFNIVFKILWLDKTPLFYTYKEPKNSIDVAYIGASNTFIHFNTVLAYNKYGFKTALYATDTQPLIVAKYLLKEAKKYQNPSVYIIDLAKVTSEMEEYIDEVFRRCTDSMKFSKNRIDTINEILKYKNATIDEYINHYFSFFMYHNRWKDISKSTFLGNKYLYKGYQISELTVLTKPQQEYLWDKDEIQLSESNKKILLDLIDYIKLEKLNVLFVVPKRCFDLENQQMLNNAISIIEKNNLKVINFNTLEDFNKIINFDTDLYNESHLNVYGSTKFSLYFSKYLKENYNLKDRRIEGVYDSWNSEYDRLKETFNTMTGRNFDDMLVEYENNFNI